MFAYNLDPVSVEGSAANVISDDTNLGVTSSAFGGLLFVGRSRYNDIVRIAVQYEQSSLEII